ncbi:aldose 1-epimerase [Cellulomonas sp. SLBN-39]|uniref:aldose 1-epimerase n=1 Tax=Cellulomonas sp. SLBN-39 TaxID=2768446 RepID=UPI001153431E|nr:aldose epimerase [Cellulomonas sp. SLBN-39]TQL02510.1 aldose 1-epimerase [Cellulomonas sp. SLBN-39]
MTTVEPVEILTSPSRSRAAATSGPLASAISGPRTYPDAPDEGAPHVLTLRSSAWELDVVPSSGAALSAGRVRTADGVWRDLLRPTRRTALGDPERCASFPMIPWSNRVRDGVLRFGGRSWQLQRNAADGTAIHGAVCQATWEIDDLGPSHVSLVHDSGAWVGSNFPWRFRARITYAVDGPTMAVTTTVENADREPFPAGFGHHPYLRRALLPVQAPVAEYPLSAGPLLEVPARAGYRLHRAIPDGPAGRVPARADFRMPRLLGNAFVDDVLTDLEPGRPVRVTYPEDGVVVEIQPDETFSHLVIYAPRKRCYFAVEPVTNVNDGFALHEAGVPGTGVFVLEPGEQRTGTFTVTTRS